MNDVLAPIAGRVGKLIRLLSSDRDGEVIATVRVLLRTLQSAELDIHALARRIEMPNGFSETEARELYDAGYQDGLQAAEKAQQGADCFRNIDGRPSWHEMSLWCQQRSDRLREREREFINQMSAQTVWRKPTERQSKWLKSIFYRLGGKPR